ncbi:conserved hypothetical protein [Coccidioides posadasii str. Silveira]|uniref:Uncharacterized protein n=1 Tax=Coccidioides posadasii (strain RMSCC 757 / Silveira) TaxID=443226 RepID=E9CXZ1_COCPS|nr:conserved hypothetical protein [Coccidioides posadasii str. Silveira]
MAYDVSDGLRLDSETGQDLNPERDWYFRLNNNVAHRILFVAGQQLSPFAHSPQARAVLALPGQDVPFVRGSMNEYQVLSHQPSYINAILIQSHGRPKVQACIACRGGPGLCLFPECCWLPGHFSRACGNCKWCDHASCCSIQDGEDAVEVIEIVDSDEEDGSQQSGGCPRALITDGSTPSFAILIE